MYTRKSSVASYHCKSVEAESNWTVFCTNGNLELFNSLFNLNKELLNAKLTVLQIDNLRIFPIPVFVFCA